MKTVFYKCTFLLILMLSTSVLFAQNLFGLKDLNKVQVDQLSDADIAKYQQHVRTSGLSDSQAEQLAINRGFPSAEMEKLRVRLSALQQSGVEVPSENKRSSDRRSDVSGMTAFSVPTTETSQTSKVFGFELFSTQSLSFQPDVKMATPVNYEVGPDDELLISVYGLQEAAFNLTVSPEGTIYIPNVGEIKVSGETIESATSKIKNRMSGIAYGSLRSGSSRISVALGKIRSIRVTILGATRPGTYTVSSLSTLFNLLYQAGGPSVNGSFREIELLRNNKVERKIDLYNFLLNGSQSDNVRLRENDVVRIPVYKKRVEISGEVRRPGVFEMVGNEKVSDLIKIASGFSDSAYRASIKVVQLTSKDKKVLDLDEAIFDNYVPYAGDYFEVSKILNRYQNRVSINGAVFRPGIFEITDNLTAGKLIKKAEGLREDAFTGRAQIIRLKSDLTTEIISFDVKAAVNGTVDIPLMREDNILISSIFDLKDKYNVTIQGEVRKPNSFAYFDSLSLKDLILQAGGFTDAAYPQKIEIARLIKRDTLTASDVRLSEIIDVQNMTDLSLNNKNVTLKPFDVVTVRRSPGYLALQSVMAEGQVQFPGPYVLSTRLEKVSDLLARSGGLAPEAFAAGAYLRRANSRDLRKNIQANQVEKIQEQLRDSSGQVSASIMRQYDQIPLDLKKIIANPNCEDNLVLKPGDELYVPRNDEEIKITGEILYPTQAPYNKSKSLKKYISDAGGFTENARKGKVYVLYPNGKAVSTTHFLGFKKYPTITPGSSIVVPQIC